MYSEGRNVTAVLRRERNDCRAEDITSTKKGEKRLQS